MSYHIVVRRSAATDISEARAWYETEQAGLGNSFLDAVQSALDGLVAGPLRYPVALRDARRVLVFQFISDCTTMKSASLAFSISTVILVC